MSVQIQLRRGTAAQWSSADPVLAQGELGVTTDTGVVKIGNGATAWNALGALGSGYTQEQIEDFIGAMVSGNTETGISVTYDDAGGKLNFDATHNHAGVYLPVASFSGLAKISVGTSTPGTPSVGDLWVDTN